MSMSMEIIVNALINCGGYAVLCYLMLQQMEKQTESHRSEVSGLEGVIRENTKAVSALVSRLGVWDVLHSEATNGPPAA